MKRRIRLFINDRLATMSDESIVLYNFSQSELSNPTIVKNSFSHTFDLPGDAVNNAIFGDYFRLDRQSTEGSFNALQRVPFSIYNEMSEVVERGYLKLNSVKRKGSLVVSYNVSLFGGLGDFFYHLMYNEDGTQKTLADLVLPYGDGTITPRNYRFFFSRGFVANAWAHNPSDTPSIFDILQFAPAYNGLPSDFSANRAITYARVSGGYKSSLSNVAFERQNGDGAFFYPMPGTRAAVMLEMAEQHTEWEVGDLRSYLQRPALSVKALLNAFTLPENGNGYTFRLDERVFGADNDYYTKTWLTLPLLPREKANSIVSLADFLEGTESPARYLIDFAKMFGLVFDLDSAMKTITLTSRDLFYRDNSSNVIDLTKRISKGDECTINPFLASSKYYIFQSPANDALGRAYKATYGREYGSQTVNTGYDFDAAPVDLLKDVVYKGAVDAIEASPYYFDNAIAYTKMLQPNILSFKFGRYEDVKYKLYNNALNDEGVEELKSEDFSLLPWTTTDDSGRSLLNDWNASAPGKDFMPKVQLHSDANKAEDGANVLLFFNGKKDIPYIGEGGSAFRANLYLSDDTEEMNMLNGGTPCWIAMGFETQGESEYITRLSSLPSFRRVYAPSGTYALSLDYGAPRETYTQDIFVEGVNIYDKLWSSFIADRYDQDAKVLSCKVDLRGLQVTPALLKRFFWYENSLWILSKITNHSVTTDDLTECEFVKITSIRAYAYGQTFSAGATPVYELSVSPESLEMSADGESKTINVSSNYDWHLGTLPAWLTASVTSGTGNATITLTASANESGAGRSAVVRVIGSDGKSASVSVTQRKIEVVLTINGVPERYPATGEQTIAYDTSWVRFEVYSNKQYTIVDPGHAFVDIEGTFGPGTTSFNKQVRKNTGAEDVINAIQFKVNGIVVAVWVVKRLAHVVGYSYDIVLSSAAVTIPASGGSRSITVVGRTYEDGALTSTVQLSASDLTIEKSSGSAGITRSGLTFSAADLGTTESQESANRYSIKWTAHPEAPAKALDVTRQGNAVVDTSTTVTAYNFLYTMGAWQTSKGAVAASSGDRATINTALSTMSVKTVKTYTSGATKTENSSRPWAPILSARGEGLTVTGSGTNYTAIWGANDSHEVRYAEIVAKTSAGAEIGTIDTFQEKIADTITYELTASPEDIEIPASGGSQAVTIVGKKYVNGVLDSQQVLDASVLSIDKGEGDYYNQISRQGLTFAGANLGTTLRSLARAPFIFGWNGASLQYDVFQEFNDVEETQLTEVSRRVTTLRYNDFNVSGSQIASHYADTTRLHAIGLILQDVQNIYTSGATESTAQEEWWEPLAGTNIKTSASWVTVSGNYAGGEHNVAVSQNDSYLAREAAINVEHGGSVLQTVQLKQAGKPTGSNIVIQVFDETGEPALGAQIAYSSNGNIKRVEADEDGIFIIPNGEIVTQQDIATRGVISFIGYKNAVTPGGMGSLRSKYTAITLEPNV